MFCFRLLLLLVLFFFNFVVVVVVVLLCSPFDRFICFHFSLCFFSRLVLAFDIECVYFNIHMCGVIVIRCGDDDMKPPPLSSSSFRLWYDTLFSFILETRSYAFSVLLLFLFLYKNSSQMCLGTINKIVNGKCLAIVYLAFISFARWEFIWFGL